MDTSYIYQAWEFSVIKRNPVFLVFFFPDPHLWSSNFEFNVNLKKKLGVRSRGFSYIYPLRSSYSSHYSPWGYLVERWVRGCAAQIGCFFGLWGFPMTPFLFENWFRYRSHFCKMHNFRWIFPFSLPIGCQKVLMHPNLYGKKYWLVLKRVLQEANDFVIGCKFASSLVLWVELETSGRTSVPNPKLSTPPGHYSEHHNTF